MQPKELVRCLQVGPCQWSAQRGRCRTCILDSSPFFAGLSVEAKRMLQSLMRFSRYERRDTLYRAGEHSQRLFVIVSGTVKIYQSLPDARQQIHKLVQIPGDLLGCEDLYRDSHTGTAEALSLVTACHLSKSAIHHASEAFAEINETLLRAMARDLTTYIRHIASLGHKSAVGRVGSYLLYRHDTHEQLQVRGNSLPKFLTRTELAEMLGITKRTLIRSLRQLEKEGLITAAKEGFIIRDLEGLIRAVDCFSR